MRVEVTHTNGIITIKVDGAIKSSVTGGAENVAFYQQAWEDSLLSKEELEAKYPTTYENLSSI